MPVRCSGKGRWRFLSTDAGGPGRDRVVFRCASGRYREWGHDCFRMEFRHRCRCLRRRALGRGRSVPADRTVPDTMGGKGCPASLTGGRSGCGSGEDRAEAGEPTRQSGAGRFSGRALLIWVLFPRRWRGGAVVTRRPEKVGEREADGRGACFSGEDGGGRGGAERRFHLPIYRRFGLLWPADCSGERMRVPYSDRPRLGRRVRPSFGKRGSTISHRHIDRYGRTGKRKGEAAASPFRGSLSLPAKGRRQSVVRIIWR